MNNFKSALLDLVRIVAFFALVAVGLVAITVGAIVVAVVWFGETWLEGLRIAYGELIDGSGERKEW